MASLTEIYDDIEVPPPSPVNLTVPLPSGNVSLLGTVSTLCKVSPKIFPGLKLGIAEAVRGMVGMVELSLGTGPCLRGPFPDVTPPWRRVETEKRIALLAPREVKNLVEKKVRKRLKTRAARKTKKTMMRSLRMSLRFVQKLRIQMEAFSGSVRAS